jgi:DNA-directed RNA polymerase specialized sigma24 family protein
MTKELLEQYPDICAEISELKAKDNAAVSDVVQASADEFPFNLHSVTVRGMPNPKHAGRIRELEVQKEEIEQFVFHLPNPTVRRIVMLRAWHGYSWDGVAAQMSKNGKSLSAQTLKKKYYGIFGK